MGATKLRQTHALILQALEIANMAAERVVTVSEVRRALTEGEAEIVCKAYSGDDLPTLIGKVLGLLVARGLAFSPGKVGPSRYYGSKEVLDPTSSLLPNALSRRARVARLVGDAVAERGRAVLLGEITSFASSDSRYCDIAPSDIAHDVTDLAAHENGEVQAVGRVHGDRNGGTLYLPKGLPAEAYLPEGPLTWLDQVARAVDSVWADELSKAEAEGKRPRPFPTSAVVAALKASHSPHPNLSDPRLVPNALIQLSREGDKYIRKVNRLGERMNSLWAPICVGDDELELGSAFATDAERAAEALRRAVDNMGRPVTSRDVQDEIDQDPSLRPCGDSTVSRLLTDLAKETISEHVGRRRGRVTRRCFWAGRAGGASYYEYRESCLKVAEAFVQFTAARLEWGGVDSANRLSVLETCPVPSIAVGRALTLAADVEAVASAVEEIVAAGHADKRTREELAELRHEIDEAAGAAHRWLSEYDIDSMNLPRTVVPLYPLKGAAEVREFLIPFYPAAARVGSLQKFITLLGDNIRRVENPDFASRFSKNPRLAAEHLYDQVDLLLQTAKRWGGRESCFQAMFVEKILERLRDPRFVYPALKSKNFEDRLAGVSCLAFLSSREGNGLLRRLAARDSDPGVRKSALWAYCFAAGDGAAELALEIARNDPERFVKDFAARACDTVPERWLML